MEEVVPGFVEAEEGRWDLKLGLAGGKADSKTLKVMVVAVAAAVYFVF